MTTKELVHDSSVNFKGWLVEPSTIYIRETQISRLLAVLGYQPHAFSLGSDPHRIQFLTRDS